MFGAVGGVEGEPLLAGVPVEGGTGTGGVVGEQELVVDEAVGGEAVDAVVGVVVGIDVVGKIALGEEGNLEVFGNGELVAEAIDAESFGDVVGVIEAAVGLEEAVDGSAGFDVLA